MFETSFTCTGCGTRVLTFRMWNYRTVPPSMDTRDLCERCKRGADMPAHIDATFEPLTIEQRVAALEKKLALDRDFSTIELRMKRLEKKLALDRDFSTIELRMKRLEERVDQAFQRQFHDLYARITALESDTDVQTLRKATERVSDIEQLMARLKTALRGSDG